MKYGSFHEKRFRSSVDGALKQVKAILDSSRHPRLAEDEDHTYNDKYALAEFLTNMALASERAGFNQLGLDSEKLTRVLGWVHDDKLQVRLRFDAYDTCSLLRTQDVDLVTHEHQHETSSSTSNVSSNTTHFSWRGTSQDNVTSKIVTKVKEYHWKVDLGYKIIVFAGTDPEGKSVELQSRNTSTVLITSEGMSAGKNRPPPPIAEATVHPSIDANITWLFQNISHDDKQVCQFHINRNVKDAKGNLTCKTPRRNKDIQGACEYTREISEWTHATVDFFHHRVEIEILAKHHPAKQPEAEPGTHPLSGVSAKELFCPVLPLMEKESVLTIGDTNKFLSEQERSIEEATNKLSQMYPPHQLAKAVTVAEAKLVLMCRHLSDLATQYVDSLDYIENMLTKQLVQAIGRHVHVKEFDAFMRFQSRKLFAPEYAPSPFCYAIRRPNHYPDGVLSIEGIKWQEQNEPIDTMVRHVVAADDSSIPSIFIPINAATSVEITGDRYLHGWMQHRFESEPRGDYQMVARARQFSSFLLVVGTMAGANSFDPKHAIILKDKDEVFIPLQTSLLPSAKEFKDAIMSLSPEQQAFCKAFRGMQLESSVFAVCVIQLKPQLEKLLGLPDGALTKEIQLTQDLMSLFIEYQIPSDLLSFDGDAAADQRTKVEAVRNYVKAVTDVIDSAKEKQLIDEERKADMRGEMAYSTVSLAAAPARMAIDGMAGGARIAKQGLDGMARAPIALAQTTRRLGSARSSARKQAAPMEGPTPHTLEHPPVEANASPVDFGDNSIMVEGETYPGTDATMSAAATGPAPKASGEDFTLIPKLLDAKLEKYDTDGSLCSTIIKAATSWTRSHQANLLTAPKSTGMVSSDIDNEKKKAFDLLEAISRSGSLPIRCAELHIVVAVSHCFDNDVMGTIIEDNINPIEKVERSALMIASTIHGVQPKALIQNEEHYRQLTGSFPLLFDAESAADS